MLGRLQSFAEKLRQAAVQRGAGIFIALERGYYQEEGIDLEMAQVDVGAQTIGFLASGQRIKNEIRLTLPGIRFLID